jgi:heme exporter protein B
LVGKDLLLEVRNREGLTAVLVYALLVLVTFNFALDLRPEVLAAVGPGVLWVAVVFTGPVTLGRAFSEERDQGTLDLLLAAPMDRGALFAAKLTANALLMAASQVVLVPAFIAMFNVQVDLPTLIPALLLGDVGLAAVGTMFSAMAAHTRAREVLLPILIFPIIVPLVIAVVQITSQALSSAMTIDRPWLGLLAAFDAVYLAMGAVLFEYVLEE